MISLKFIRPFHFDEYLQSIYKLPTLIVTVNTDLYSISSDISPAYLFNTIIGFIHNHQPTLANLPRRLIMLALYRTPQLPAHIRHLPNRAQQRQMERLKPLNCQQVRPASFISNAP